MNLTKQILPKDLMKDTYILYARKSSESEERQAESIPAQLDILHKLADSRNIIVGKVFKESYSAKAPGRPQFNEMVNLIQSTGVKGILCWKLNRLFRNPADEGLIRWLLTSGKIGEIVTPSKIYHDADSDFTMAVEGAQAQRFIKDLREDTARGIQRKLSRGIAPILAPAGYYNDKTKNQGDKDILPHPVYFDLVRQIFNLALTGNYSTEGLYKKALEMKIMNNHGKPISRTQMYRMLTNKFYKGQFEYGKQVYLGAHKPMITSEEYDLIQNNLKERTHPRNFKHEWPLTGLLKCGVCGRGITAEEHKKPSGNVFAYYKCTGLYRYGCVSKYVPLNKIEDMAYDYLGKIKLSTKFVDWAVKVLKRASQEEKESYKDKYEALRKEQDRINEKLYNLQVTYATSGLIDEDVFIRGTNELRERRNDIHQLLQGEDKNFDEITDITVATLRFASEAQKNWKEKGTEYRKGIMKVVGEELILNAEGKLEIKPRTPFLIIEKAVQSSLKNENARLNSVVEAKTSLSDYSSTIVGRLPNDLRTHYTRSEAMDYSIIASLLLTSTLGQQFAY